jgi:pyruvate dehydrogenase E2 component (dihydrolipoamide acetyltransferase)
MSENTITPLTMPKWGLSMKEGKLINWLVEEGSQFSRGDELAEVETEKIASAVEASMAGTLRKIVAENDTVYPVGALLAVVADESVSDDEVNAYIEKFQSEFVPEESGDEDEGIQAQTIEVNSLNIRYLSKGDGDRVLLLVHGYGGDLDNWLFNHDELVEKTGMRVIALDLPGHGQSSKVVGDANLEFFADTIHAFLQALDIEKAYLVGHSMGGAISLCFASKYPDNVLGLGLIASAGLGDEINNEYIQGFMESTSRKQIKPWLELLFADKSLVNRQLINNMLQYKRLDGVSDALNAVSRQLLDDSGKQGRQFLDSLDTLACRICVVWGMDDHIIPASHTERLPDSVSKLVIESSGHMVQMEAANKVNQFLIDNLLTR